MRMNKFFLSCDWGTSSFRLRLIDGESLTVLAEEKQDTGIAATHKAWQASGLPREEFYAEIIDRQIDTLARKLGTPLSDLPVVLSGMASSSIGMVELPYQPLPFPLNGAGLVVQAFRRYLIISGGRTSDDVMRGEETKIIGCAGWLAGKPDALLILPGTHPKHVLVSSGIVHSFQTFMTGELFDLLATHSILAASVEGGGPFSDTWFEEGVKAGQAANLLHAGFMVRTNQVLKKVPPQHNYFYLSGLLIGAELKEVKPGLPVYIVGGALHTPLYARACSLLNIPVAGRIDADEALIRGQWEVLNGR